MKFRFLMAASAVALAAFPAPALAQHMHMPGITMPNAEQKKPAAKAKPAAKNKSSKKATTRRTAEPHASHLSQPEKSAAPDAPMTMPMEHESVQMPPAPAAPMSMPMDDGSMEKPGEPAGPMPMPMDHSQMDHAKMPDMAHGSHSMPAALGRYPMTRESSGTSWQPDASQHLGLMEMSGGWMVMAHGVVNGVYDHQSGPRGDDKAFVSGMIMGMASHPLGDGNVQFKAMLSPDPLMGPRGYPLLLATGETANGVDRLFDRQHPHDLFMELSASVSQHIGPNGSVFLYGGLPGEPAFGPPAFMHRESIMDSPEAPISHHWLDSTHISFGVLTAGIVLNRVKLEVSRFNAREPDQHRWNIETGPLDSTSVRLSWNPTRTLALQGSWGRFKDPEQLEPGIDQKRLSASLLWANDVAPGWHVATTLAWGRKTAEHHDDDALAVEGSVKHSGWTVFGRGEVTENRELLPLVDHGPAFTVGKVSLGAVRDFRIAEHFSVGAGGLVSLNFVPDSIAPLYGGNNPLGAMAFVRLKLD